MLTLIERAGDLATKDIWHSTVQIITNYPDLHEYAARKVSCAAGTCYPWFYAHDTGVMIKAALAPHGAMRMIQVS